MDIHSLTRLYPFMGSIPTSDPDKAVDWPLPSLIRKKKKHAVPASQRVDDLLHYSIGNPQATSFKQPDPERSSNGPWLYTRPALLLLQ